MCLRIMRAIFISVFSENVHYHPCFLYNILNEKRYQLVNDMASENVIMLQKLPACKFFAL